MNAGWSTGLIVERLNDGLPLISADPNGWDSGFTLNPAAIRLDRSPLNDFLISGMLGPDALSDSRLSDGVVVVYYRGIPSQSPADKNLRSSVGMAVFTPDMHLIKRFRDPVVLPTNDPTGYDYQGVEDQRIARIGDTFYMLYCGYNPNLPPWHNIHICMAKSKDLINWTKLGPVRGNVNDVPNKDAVMLGEPVDGNYFMLHRPCIGEQGRLSISLAISDSPTGVWRDLGVIMRPIRHPKYSCSWVGAGSTPIALGDGRFLCDYHTGNYYSSGERDYFVSFAVLNFNNFDICRSEQIVESRCEAVIVPETEYELNSPWPHDKNLNCVFPCGSYSRDGDIVLIYGGADAYVLAARLKKNELISHLDAIAAFRSTQYLRGSSDARVPKSRQVYSGISQNLADTVKE